MKARNIPRDRSSRRRTRPWLRALVAVVCLGLLVLLVIPALNLAQHRVHPVDPHAKLGKAPSFTGAVVVLQEKCGSCHVPQAPLPFYAKLPFVGDLVQEDVAMGLRAFNMADSLYQASQPPSPVALAKLEQSLRDGSMPPAAYKAMHWDAFVQEADLALVNQWVQEERARHYASPNVHPSLRAEVVQPIPPNPDSHPAKVALGRKLFHDKRLSGDETISCASCHNLAEGGADNRQFSKGIRGQIGTINAPTVYNAGFNRLQFWDGRAKNLEEQAKSPVENPVEMGATWSSVVEKLGAVDEYREAFEDVYEGPVNESRILDALAHFEQTLTTPNAPFDRYLQTGDDHHISSDARSGYRLFKDNGCTNCHVGVALGGQSFEVMGLAQNYFGLRGGPLTEADYGRYNVTKDPADKFRFKVPTLRNVALTAPYFHDGYAQTLEEAVKIMAQVQRGTALSEREVEQIVAFLESLTGVPFATAEEAVAMHDAGTDAGR